jgi:DNA-binding Xre family transcriptional regulator
MVIGSAMSGESLGGSISDGQNLNPYWERTFADEPDVFSETAAQQPNRRRSRRYRQAVSPRRPDQTDVRTKLAALRVQRGVTQAELAAAVGIALATYRRLERGRVPSPPLRYLSNCAIALGVELEDLIEDEWREWFVFDQHRAATPPSPDGLWRDLVPDS